VETNAENFRFSAGGFLAEIDRMKSEVIAYFSDHPVEYMADFLAGTIPLLSVQPAYRFRGMRPEHGISTRDREILEALDTELEETDG
jgi:hypothetical protein